MYDNQVFSPTLAEDTHVLKIIQERKPLGPHNLQDLPLYLLGYIKVEKARP